MAKSDVYVMPLRMLEGDYFVKTVKHQESLDAQQKNKEHGLAAIYNPKREPNFFPSNAFMKGFHFTLLGYPPVEHQRVQPIVKYLIDQGGAIKDRGLQPQTRLVSICPRYLGKITSEVPGLVAAKKNPDVIFVSGLNQLEQCCKEQKYVNVAESDLLFPAGGILVLQADLLLGNDDAMDVLLSTIESEKKRGREWIIKIDRVELTAIQKAVATSQRAKRAMELLGENLGSIVKMVRDDEKSKSTDNPVPAVVRCALKILFLNAKKYRQVILLSENKTLQTTATQQNLMCMGMNDVKSFFAEQAQALTNASTI
eukprot:TRINITY_DN17893_c0_g1_i1.p1 TRINITY_DN17893_c0_g1~~TRINITY_DN17893_c0_g1_i1.p1  ORF type:complete len:338 (+),score=64.27 TRINITY_DN17893_c0_g1_i1:81-1016(+)